VEERENKRIQLSEGEEGRVTQRKEKNSNPSYTGGRDGRIQV
jgi:hypothetical protein